LKKEGAEGGWGNHATFVSPKIDYFGLQKAQVSQWYKFYRGLAQGEYELVIVSRQYPEAKPEESRRITTKIIKSTKRIPSSFLFLKISELMSPFPVLPQI